MGAQHSTPVPTISELNYFPEKDKGIEDVPALSKTLAPPGERPGELYGLKLGKLRRGPGSSDSSSKSSLLLSSSYRSIRASSRSSTLYAPRRKPKGSSSCRYRPITKLKGTTKLIEKGRNSSFDVNSSEVFANGLQLSSPANTMRQRMVLNQTDGTVRAVIMRKSTLRSKVYQILSPKPLYPNQAPEPECFYDSYKLFLWAEVQQRPRSLQFEMVISASNKIVIRYVTDYCGPVLSPSAQMRTTNPQGQTCAYFRRSRNEWDVFVGPGVCPLLMICYVSVIQLH